MRKLAAAFAAACALCVHAADPDRVREAHALFDAMHLETQMDATTRAMSQIMAQQLSASEKDPRIAQIMMSETMSVVKEMALEPGGLVDTMAEAYADLFTLDELREIRRFYESPAGRKMLSRVPEMMPRVMGQSMARMKEAAPLICNRTKARLAAEGLDTAATSLKCP
jgi:hypothetical protein